MFSKCITAKSMSPGLFAGLEGATKTTVPPAFGIAGLIISAIIKIFLYFFKQIVYYKTYICNLVYICSNASTKEEIMMETLKVSANSVPKSVAGAIAAIVRGNEPVEVVTIGAAAVNQAVKSIAIARGYVAPNGIDLICVPAFSQIDIEGNSKTSIKFVIERR